MTENRIHALKTNYGVKGDICKTFNDKEFLKRQIYLISPI